eukprot:scaffold6824_cov118-Isochrysis_galbana.AAC.3
MRPSSRARRCSYYLGRMPPSVEQILLTTTGAVSHAKYRVVDARGDIRQVRRCARSPRPACSCRPAEGSSGNVDQVVVVLITAERKP